MSYRLKVVLESELEVDKLKDLEQSANKDGEFEILYDNLKTEKDDKDAQAEGNVVPEEDSDTSSSSTDDSETDTDSSDSETTEALESIRNLTYSPEGFSEVFSSIKDHVGSAAVALKDAAVVLGVLGITYGPGIAAAMYKGVVYVFLKLVKLLYVSTVTITKYIDRRINSFNNLSKEINQAKASIQLIRSGKASDLNGAKYSNQKVINTLKIGSNVNFDANIKRLHTFVHGVVHELDGKVSTDIGAIKHLIAYSYGNTGRVPNSLMMVKPMATGMSPGVIDGYQSDNEFIDSYKYNERLPSDVTLIAQLPKPELVKIDELSQAYSDSRIALAFDPSSFIEISSVDYMTIDDLSRFVESLDMLCKMCMEHQSLYEKVKHTKSGLKFSFKNYFMSLATADHKVGMKDSLVEYVYLKSMFIDKVYLTAAMDIHDYSSKVISLSLSYVKDNIKKLS